MTYRNPLIIGAAVALLMAAGYWLSDSPMAITDVGQKEHIDQDADYFLVDAVIKEYTATGTLKYQMKSDNITHYPYNDHTLMQMPVLRNYGDDQQVTTTRADNGKLLAGGNDVDLWNNVVVVQDSFSNGYSSMADNHRKRIRMETDFITVALDEEIANTNHPVVITNENGVTHSAGMTAFLQQGHIHLKSRVRGTYEPN